MRHGLKRALLALVVVMAVGVVLAAAGGAAVTTTAPVTGTAHNSCTGELVYYQGTQHVTMRESTNGGRLHFGVTEHLSGVTATTAAGVRYAMADTTTGSSNFDSDVIPFEFTAMRSLVLTRLGEDGSFVAGDDLRLHVVAHTTVNANGTVTADFKKTRIECV